MNEHVVKRDYSLSGALNAVAVETGLANAEWYKTHISRKRMKQLMQRSDQPATRDTLIWLGAMLLTGGAAVWLWPHLASVPLLLVYGLLYASGADSRWHEASHGTVFRTRWKNEALYQLSSFMIMRNPVVWRWSHARHHTDTIIVGRDPEIAVMRPPDIARALSNLLGISDGIASIGAMLRHAAGRLSEDEKDFVPTTERAKVYRVARIWLVVYAAVGAACVATGGILPALLVGLPRFYGIWHGVLCGVTQHAGLAEDVLDHRLNSRTVLMNPISRFIYSNMNYHVEHHMFPMVPYHRLPELHREIAHDCPKPYRGFIDAYREIIPTLARQLHDTSHYAHRVLPPSARPSPAPMRASPDLQAAQ